MRRLAIACTLLALAAAVLGGCGQAAGPGQPSRSQAPPASQPQPATAPAAPEKVTVGLLPLVSSAPLFVAADKGFFKEENLDVEFKWFDAAQPIAVAVASGQVDVGATGLTAGLYNLMAGGQKILVVADKGREWPAYNLTAVVASPAEAKAGTAQLKQLKGKRIGITQIGSTFHYSLARMLEKEGMQLSDVQLVPLNSLTAMLEAVDSGQVHAAVLPEPNVTRAVKKGARVVAWVGDVYPWQVAAVFYSPRFAGRQDVAVRFMKAYVKANRYYYDALLQQKDGKVVRGANADEVLQIITKYVKAPVEDIATSLTYIDRDARLVADDLPRQVEWYAQQGMIKGSLDVRGFVDTSFLDAALKALGR